ncbi:hypothetical protein ACQ4PT_032615 [Festuca glaucescens]
MITVDHIQKGVLLPKPPTTGGQGRLHAAAVEHLASSFARALGRFYPFAGRLAVTPGRNDYDEGSPKSLVVSLRCSGEGAEFVHAVAPGVTAALCVPRVVWSFFQLNGVLGADAIADSRPVMAAQVTELADGVFVALSLNHAVADGTAFWRRFALLAHLWRAACRARKLAPGQETLYSLLVGCGARVDGVPTAYAGNAVTHAAAQSPAGDILDRGLGWAAWLLNRAVASFDERSARDKLASWPGEPSFPSIKAFSATAHTSFADGELAAVRRVRERLQVTVRSGAGNKLDGKVTVYEGRGGAGSMALEVCLAPEALARLVADEEFMGAVGATDC